MSLPTELGVSFTPAEVSTMKAALDSVITIIRSKKTLNLSNTERKSVPKIGNDRLPFAHKSIKTYGVDYPALNGLAYPFSMAAADMETYNALVEVMTKIKETSEVTEEMQMVAGHFCLKFMKDQYHNAKRYLGDNVAGAQVVYDGLKPCFEQHGSVVNPTAKTGKNR